MIDKIKKILFMDDDLCYICMKNKSVDNSNICDFCKSKMKYIDGKRYISNDIICSFPLHYSGVVKDIIYGYKFLNKTYLYKIFGNIMVEFLENKEISDIDYLVYIPSSKKTVKKRGFEHLKYICEYISEKLNIELLEDVLIKTKNTKLQHDLDIEERYTNLKNAFEIKDKDKIKGKKILLFDDIITTGNTFNTAIELLLENNVEKIKCISIASLKKEKYLG